MPEERFNGEQVSAVFIKVGAKCVPKRMAGETVLPAKFSFFGGNKLVYRIRGHGLLGIITVREEESHGSAGMEPVLCQDIQCILGKDGITVRTCLGMTDMYAHGRAADILVAEGAGFANPQPGRIQERKNRLVLEVGKRLDKIPDLILCRNKRKVGIKSAHRELCGIPGFVQNVNGEETELGNAVVHSAVRKTFLSLEPPDKITQFIPGDIFGHLMEDAGKIIQVSTDVGRIRCYSMVSKTAQGDHLPESR